MQVDEILTPPGAELPKKPQPAKIPGENELPQPGDSAQTVSSVPLGETTASQDQGAETVSGVPLGEPSQPNKPQETSGTVYFPQEPLSNDSGEHPKNCRCDKCPPVASKHGRHPNGCRCGRCNQSGRTSPGSGSRADFSDLNQEQQNAVDYKAQAEMLFDLATNTLGGLVGPEWLPVKPEPGRPGERDWVCAPLAKYLESKGMVDLPPGYMVCFMCALYSLPRLREENTKSVLKKAWTSICDFWFWLKGKFS